jgi:hypothetical protein
VKNAYRIQYGVAGQSKFGLLLILFRGGVNVVVALILFGQLFELFALVEINLRVLVGKDAGRSIRASYQAIARIEGLTLFNVVALLLLLEIGVRVMLGVVLVKFKFACATHQKLRGVD